MNPAFPWAEPWQVPALQPSRESTGATSWTKSTLGDEFTPSTVTGTSTDWPARRRTSVALPSARGRTSPDREMSAIGDESDGSTIRVASTVSPEASRPVTRSWT